LEYVKEKGRKEKFVGKRKLKGEINANIYGKI
jgi:hypothetical protein